MKKMKSNKVYSSIFFNGPCSFPPERYSVLPAITPPSNAQYIFGFGVTPSAEDGEYHMDSYVPGIILVPSVSSMIRIVDSEGVPRTFIESGVKGLRYIKNLEFTFDYNQQNLHNASVGSILVILKVPLNINFQDIFYHYRDSNLSVEEEQSVVYPHVYRLMYGDTSTYEDIPSAHNRIGSNKYIIGYEYLPCYNNQYFQHKIKIRKEITLHSDERIVAFVVSYDLSTRSGSGVHPNGVLPNDPWEESSSHPVDLCFIGWISGIVSYDISF